MTLTTTVVGSYPAYPSRQLMIDSYHRGEDPFVQSIEDAVRAQVETGIELVSDGSTRDDMISLFARGLRGFRIKDNIQIVNDIGYKGSITLSDHRLAKSLLPAGRELKGIITGPCTLVMASKDFYYDDRFEAIMAAAKALNEEVRALSQICEVVQVDEPFLSLDMPEYAEEALELTLDADVLTALHVCGDVSEVVDSLIEIDVDILDHEFAANPALFDIYAEIDHPQELAVGVVTTEPKVEEVDRVKERIERALELFGPDTMVDPDCGLKNLTSKTAYEKLKNMVIARNVVLDERS